MMPRTVLAAFLSLLTACAGLQTPRDYELAAQDVRDVAALVEAAFSDEELVLAGVNAARALADQLQLGDASAAELLLQMEPGVRQYFVDTGRMTTEIDVALTAARILLRRLQPVPK